MGAAYRRRVVQIQYNQIMKKILFLILIIFICFSLPARMKAVVDISPFFTFDSTPAGIEGLDWKNASGLQNPFWW